MPKDPLANTADNLPRRRPVSTRLLPHPGNARKRARKGKNRTPSCPRSFSWLSAGTVMVAFANAHGVDQSEAHRRLSASCLAAAVEAPTAAGSGEAAAEAAEAEVREGGSNYRRNAKRRPTMSAAQRQKQLDKQNVYLAANQERSRPYGRGLCPFLPRDERWPRLNGARVSSCRGVHEGACQTGARTVAASAPPQAEVGGQLSGRGSPCRRTAGWLHP